MHFSLDTLVSSILIALLPNLIAANTTTAPPVTSAPSSCVTVTSTNGGSCPTPTPCVVPACLLLSTVTLGCGCPSIYTERVCASTCHGGCGTSYQTLYLPCATSFSGSFSGYSTWSSSTPILPNTSTETGSVTSGSATSTGSSSKTTHSADWNGTETVICTSTVPANTTTVVVTSTSLVTISSCPAKVTCHGQTSIWTGTEGPYTCRETKTCSCVLPGGGNATLTGTGSVSSSVTPTVATTPGKGTSTTQAPGSTSSLVQVQSNGAERGVGGGVMWAEGWMVGILGLVVGGL